MMRKQAFLILGLIFILAGPLYPSGLNEAQSLFYQGNAYYSQEKFAQAIEAYEKALGLGFESGPLYYNLGNAYFKNNSLGQAILNYKRAQRLIPKDADLISNLEYVYSLTATSVAPAKRGILNRVFLWLADFFNLNGITLIGFILYLTLSALLICFFIFRPLRNLLGYFVISILILLVISGSIFCVKLYHIKFRHEAIVVAGYVDCKFEPFNDSTTYFTLQEGEGMDVISERNGWAKIRMPDGKQGWVKKEKIGLI